MAPTTISDVPFPSRSATHANPTAPAVPLVAFDEGVIFEIEHPGDAAGAVCAAAGTVTRSVAPAVTAQINPAAVSRFLCELRCVMVLIPSIEGAPNRTPGLQLLDHLPVQGPRLGFPRHATGPKTTPVLLPNAMHADADAETARRLSDG
jgi:hypothetical protein